MKKVGILGLGIWAGATLYHAAVMYISFRQEQSRKAEVKARIQADQGKNPRWTEASQYPSRPTGVSPFDLGRGGRSG